MQKYIMFNYWLLLLNKIVIYLQNNFSNNIKIVNKLLIRKYLKIK